MPDINEVVTSQISKISKDSINLEGSESDYAIYEKESEFSPETVSNSDKKMEVSQKSAEPSKTSEYKDPVEVAFEIDKEIDECVDWLSDANNWYYVDDDGWAHLKDDVGKVIHRLQVLMNLLTLLAIILAAKAQLYDVVDAIINGVSIESEDKNIKNLIEKQKSLSKSINDILLETLDTIDEINKANYEKKANEIQEKYGKPNILIGIATSLIFNTGAAENFRDAAVAREMAKLEEERSKIEYQNFQASLNFIDSLKTDGKTGDQYLDELDRKENEILSNINESNMFQYAGDNGIGDKYLDMNKNMVAAVMKAITIINNLRNIYAVIQKAKSELAKIVLETYTNARFTRLSKVWTAVQTMLNNYSGYLRSAISMNINRLNAYVQSYNNMVSQKYQYFKERTLSAFCWVPFGLADAIVLSLMPEDKNIPAQLDMNEVNNILSQWGLPVGNFGVGDQFLDYLDRMENEILEQINYSNLSKDTGDGFQDMEYEKMKNLSEKLNFLMTLRELYLMVNAAKQELKQTVLSITTGLSTFNTSSLVSQISRDEADLKTIFAKLKIDTLQKEITEHNKQRQYEIDREDAWNTWIGVGIGLGIIGLMAAIMIPIFGTGGSMFIPVALGIISSAFSIGQSIMDAIFISRHMPNKKPYTDDIFYNGNYSADEFDAECQAAIDSLLSSSVFITNESLGTVAVDPVAIIKARERIIAAYIKEMIMLAVESARKTLVANVLANYGIYVDDNTSSMGYILSRKLQYYSDVLGYKISLINRNVTNYNEYLHRQQQLERATWDIVVSVFTMLLNAFGPAIGDDIGDAMSILANVINIVYDLITTIRDYRDARKTTGDLEAIRKHIELYFEAEEAKLDATSPDYELKKQELEALKKLAMSESTMLVNVGRGYVSTNYMQIAQSNQIIRQVYRRWEALLEAQNAQQQIWQVVSGLGTSQSFAENITDAAKNIASSIISDLETFWNNYADRLNEINDAKRQLFYSTLSFIVETVFSINNIVKIVDNDHEGFLDFLDVKPDASVSDKVVNALLKLVIKQMLLIHLSELFNWLYFGTTSDIPQIPDVPTVVSTGDPLADTYGSIEQQMILASYKLAFARMKAKELQFRNKVWENYTKQINQLIANMVKEGIMTYIKARDEKRRMEKLKQGFFKRLLKMIALSVLVQVVGAFIGPALTSLGNMINSSLQSLTAVFKEILVRSLAATIAQEILQKLDLKNSILQRFIGTILQAGLQLSFETMLNPQQISWDAIKQQLTEIVKSAIKDAIVQMLTENIAKKNAILGSALGAAIGSVLNDIDASLFNNQELQMVFEKALINAFQGAINELIRSEILAKIFKDQKNIVAQAISEVLQTAFSAASNSVLQQTVYKWVENAIIQQKNYTDSNIPINNPVIEKEALDKINQLQQQRILPMNMTPENLIGETFKEILNEQLFLNAISKLPETESKLNIVVTTSNDRYDPHTNTAYINVDTLLNVKSQNQQVQQTSLFKIYHELSHFISDKLDIYDRSSQTAVPNAAQLSEDLSNSLAFMFTQGIIYNEAPEELMNIISNKDIYFEAKNIVKGVYDTSNVTGKEYRDLNEVQAEPFTITNENTYAPLSSPVLDALVTSINKTNASDIVSELTKLSVDDAVTTISLINTVNPSVNVKEIIQKYAAEMSFSPQNIQNQVTEIMSKYSKAQLSEIASMNPKGELSTKEILSLYKQTNNFIEDISDVIKFQDSNIKPDSAIVFNLNSKEVRNMVAASNNAFSTREIVNAKSEVMPAISKTTDKQIKELLIYSCALKNSSEEIASQATPTTLQNINYNKQLAHQTLTILSKVAQFSDKDLKVILDSLTSSSSSIKDVKEALQTTLEIIKSANISSHSKTVLQSNIIQAMKSIDKIEQQNSIASNATKITTDYLENKIDLQTAVNMILSNPQPKDLIKNIPQILSPKELHQENSIQLVNLLQEIEEKATDYSIKTIAEKTLQNVMNISNEQFALIDFDKANEILDILKLNPSDKNKIIQNLDLIISNPNSTNLKKINLVAQNIQTENKNSELKIINNKFQPHKQSDVEEPTISLDKKSVQKAIVPPKQPLNTSVEQNQIANIDENKTSTSSLTINIAENKSVSKNNFVESNNKLNVQHVKQAKKQKEIGQQIQNIISGAGSGGASAVAQSAAAAASVKKDDNISGTSSTAYRANLESILDVFTNDEIITINADLQNMDINTSKVNQEEIQLLKAIIGIKNRARNAENKSESAKDPSFELASLKKPIEQLLLKLNPKLDENGKAKLKELSEQIKEMDFSKVENVIKTAPALQEIISTLKTDKKLKQLMLNTTKVIDEHLANVDTNLKAIAIAQKIVSKLIKGADAEVISNEIKSKPNSANKVIEMMGHLIANENKTTAENLKQFSVALKRLSEDIDTPAFRKSAQKTSKIIYKIVDGARKQIAQLSMPEDTRQNALTKLNEIENILGTRDYFEDIQVNVQHVKQAKQQKEIEQQVGHTSQRLNNEETNRITSQIQKLIDSDEQSAITAVKELGTLLVNTLQQNKTLTIEIFKTLDFIYNYALHKHNYAISNLAKEELAKAILSKQFSSIVISDNNGFLVELMKHIPNEVMNEVKLQLPSFIYNVLQNKISSRQVKDKKKESTAKNKNETSTNELKMPFAQNNTLILSESNRYNNEEFSNGNGQTYYQDISVYQNNITTIILTIIEKIRSSQENALNQIDPNSINTPNLSLEIQKLQEEIKKFDAKFNLQEKTTSVNEVEKCQKYLDELQICLDTIQRVMPQNKLKDSSIGLLSQAIGELQIFQNTIERKSFAYKMLNKISSGKDTIEEIAKKIIRNKPNALSQIVSLLKEMNKELKIVQKEKFDDFIKILESQINQTVLKSKNINFVDVKRPTIEKKEIDQKLIDDILNAISENKMNADSASNFLKDFDENVIAQVIEELQYEDAVILLEKIAEKKGHTAVDKIIGLMKN